ncbi:CCA tRNA nucleotidyltransferase, mitochondrial [Entomophthora muscae]|uniref:CCA tRNA nucleotidyltransferase, mitochondrial n=1 Tax=Entomophthora muscae TaxID=34485 RepID=A0ACC2TG21_9FUNG|nr:CCA tRNA nucleotidyltransferase, mitochondrial [Entomophthora muscae]
MRLDLTPKEKELCTLLTLVADFINKKDPTKTVILRFAGGWVRDKLLGIASNDIDVAIDTMTGAQFFEYLREYEDFRGKRVLSRGTTIAANPQKSKHLETVAATVLGLEIDFVNLRSEKYSENSRVPEMTFGTPEEDAFRRDITINSLFYNIHSGEVEDFCQKGLSDLKHKLIRTPLSPTQTFIDDPLRVLRCIRFANRLRFEIAPEVIEAMSEPDIKVAFKTKISRERVGTELSKMLTSGSPLQAFELIHQCGLYETIFFPHPLREEDRSIAPPLVGIEKARILTCLFDSFDQGKDLTLPGPLVIPTPLLAEFGLSTIRDKGLLLLASFLAPFQHVMYISPKNNKVTHSIITLVKDTIKLPLAKGTAMESFYRFSARLSEILAIDSSEWSRSLIGLYMHASGPHFAESVLTWLTEQIYRNAVKIDSKGALEQKINLLLEFLNYVKDKDLQSVQSLIPLLTGDQVAKSLSIKPGVIVGYLKQEAFIWQLEHPQGSVDECQAWLLKSYGTLESRQLLSERYAKPC